MLWSSRVQRGIEGGRSSLRAAESLECMMWSSALMLGLDRRLPLLAICFIYKYTHMHAYTHIQHIYIHTHTHAHPHTQMVQGTAVAEWRELNI